MERGRRSLVASGLLAFFSLLIAACGGKGVPTTSEAPTTVTSGTITSTSEPEVSYDVGVGAEPCLGEGHNPGNGCISLGIVTDLTKGSFSSMAAGMAAAQVDFWKAVNAGGGIGGFDVDILPENTFDARFNPDLAVEGYKAISPGVVALAQILDSPEIRALLPLMEADRTVAATASWWSGWAFPDIDGGLILETGAPSCIESMNGFDWLVQTRGKAFTYATVGFPGDLGGDYAAGIRIAALANGMGPAVAELQQAPIMSGGDVAATAAVLAATKPEVIFLAVGPEELAAIVGGVYAAGHQTATYVGIGPSWDPGLLEQTDLTAILEQSYFNTSQWGGWNFDSEGHALMRAAAEDNERTPGNGYVAGWVSQYGLKALLEKALANGDLTRTGGGIDLAMSGLAEVDYQDMLPVHSFVGTPDATVERQSLVSKVDAGSPDGLTLVTPLFSGATAAGYEFGSPCYSG
jgi:hypothetical protein